MATYDRTLWGDRRKSDVDRLNTLVPDEGEVPFNPSSVALELYRQYSNAYYDIFNNGAGNWNLKGKYLRKVANYYKVKVGPVREILSQIDHLHYSEGLERLGDIVIDAALKEQFGNGTGN